VNKFRSLLALGLIFGVFMFLAGCDNASTDPKLQTGDLNDPEFEQIDALFGEGFTDMTGSMLDLTFQLIDSIPAPVGIAKPAVFATDGGLDNLDFTYSYNAETYWHVFTVSASSSEDDGFGGTYTTDFSGIDSVRFSGAQGYIQYPDDGATGANIHWHIDAEIQSTGTQFTYDSDALIALAVADLNDFVVNGTSSEDIDLAVADGESACVLSIGTDQEYTDVYVPTSESGSECPSSGRIDVSASLLLNCEGDTPEGYDELSIDSNWDIAYIFDDGTITVTYSDGTTQWTTTQSCGYEESYSPRIIPVEQ